MQIKRFSIAVMPGVILSMFGAGSASAQQYAIEASAYCHATQQVSQTCTVGSAVTITPMAEEGTGNETFNLDSDTLENGETPEVFNVKSAAFTYRTPGDKNVGIWATDGSGSSRGYPITIIDPDGKPDPGTGPAYKRGGSINAGVLFNRKTKTCQVFGDFDYESYQHSWYKGRAEIVYRPRKASTTRAKRYRRFTTRVQSRSNQPSYGPLYGSVSKMFNPNGQRLKRLAKTHIFRLKVRQTVFVNGQKVDSVTISKPLLPRSCRVPTT